MGIIQYFFFFRKKLINSYKIDRIFFKLASFIKINNYCLVKSLDEYCFIFFFQKVVIFLFFFIFSSSLPNIFLITEIGVIRKKYIKPKMIGLVNFAMIFPALIKFFFTTKIIFILLLFFKCFIGGKKVVVFHVVVI